MPEVKSGEQPPEEPGGESRGAKIEGEGSGRPEKGAGSSGKPSSRSAKGNPPTAKDPPAEAQVSKPAIKRLMKAVGMGLPSNRFRVFLGKGTIPPVSESRTFVAKLKKVDRVEISVFEGDSDRSDLNLFVGEIGVNNVQLREDEKAEIEVTFGLDGQGILIVTILDRMGGTEATAKWVLPQFVEERSDTIDFSSLPVEELSQKIDLLEQQMDLLKGELTVRRVRE
jgi:molecular chaperone DnaK (HSP70)